MDTRTSQIASADLAVAIIANSDHISSGDELIYTIQVTNYGPDPAPDTQLIDVLPSTLKNPEYSLDGGSTFQAWSGSLGLGTLNPNSFTSLLIKAGFTGGTTEEALTNTVSVSSSVTDPFLQNNEASITSAVDICLADLSIAYTVTPSTAVLGESLTFTLILSNSGPSAAKNVIFSDSLSDSLTNIKYSTDGGVIWLSWISPHYIGTLAVGEQRTILIKGEVSGTLTNAVTASFCLESPTPDPNPFNNTVTAVVPINNQYADLAIFGNIFPNPVSPCQTLIAHFSILNSGPNDAANVELSFEISSCLTNAQFSLDRGRTWNTWPGFYRLGTLPVGSNLNILIRATVCPRTSGRIRNVATVSSSSPDPNTNNNTFTCDTFIRSRRCL